MAHLLIEWRIDYEGDGDPVEAARWAWDKMRKPDSTARCFTVTDDNGNQTEVDLQEIDDGDDGCPKGGPDCLRGDGDCHDSCEAPEPLISVGHIAGFPFDFEDRSGECT